MTDYPMTRLENGLRVLSVPMRDRHSSAVAIWVRTGSRFETKKISGVSHFLEHMLFKGTRKRTTRQIKEEIEGVGGALNAFTGEESTCYFAKLLKEHYPRALDVLSDMVLNAVLSPAELAKERTVIIEEIKMYRDLPSHHVHDLMGELLWPDQPLGRAISGTPESVSAISRADMAAYMKRYYQGGNILVSFSGDIPHEEALGAVRKIFAKHPAGPAGTFSRARSRQSSPRTFYLEKKTEQTHFVIGVHGFSRFHPDRYKLGILNIILGANMSSRLFEEVREKRGLAYEIRSGISFYHDTGSVTISAGVEAAKAHKAVLVILRELSKLRARFVSEGELRRAKDYFMSQLAMGLEDTLDHLLWAGERILDGGDLPDMAKIRRSIEAVTRQDVQAMAVKLFRTSDLNLSLIGPLDGKMQRAITRDFEMP